ncbi:hypothetical protein [Acetohalobium arabaticum]|uniref:Tim44-like domain-containing protein n=1 Tax=Acetohalobium arabaticum (strain ATCC 49924 / DSM 5501 / Z-7288) TaxID=574087 RepID=D9QV74_ACEAZ|nr:hypothetical protein [Acetohalobium arabaticum]ADL12133.1 hypothetical protein Acear_0590 [Acetohalobium arabaticum DSM 5501]
MGKENDLDKIAQTVNIWCKSLIQKDEANLKSIVNPYNFRDKEIAYKNTKLIHQEDIQYTHTEYIEHVRLLWKKRKYLQTRTRDAVTYLMKEFAIYNATLQAKIKNKNDNSVIEYNDMDASFELLKIDNQWYLSGLTNIIRINN